MRSKLLILMVLFTSGIDDLLGCPLVNVNPYRQAEPEQRKVRWSEYSTPLSTINDGIHGLRFRDGITSPLRALLDQAKTLHDFLFNRWAHADPGSSSPAAYHNALTADGDILLGLAQKPFSDPDFSPTLEAVVQDLKVKADHCRLSPKGWDGLVTVVVNTKNGTNVVHGFEVWFVCKGWAKDQSKWKRFSKVSSPTSETLAPGVYLMRLRADGDAVPVEVGGDGKESKEVDLLVKL